MPPPYRLLRRTQGEANPFDINTMKRPAINLWVLLLLGIILFGSLLLTAWCFRDVFLTPIEIAEKHPDRFDRFYIYNLFIFIMSLLVSLMCIATFPMILLKKRNSWIWYTVLSILILAVLVSFQQGTAAIFNLLITGIVAYLWYSEQNRLWYKVLYTRKK